MNTMEKQYEHLLRFLCLEVWSEWINFQIRNDVFCLYLSLPVEDIASVYNHLYHIQNNIINIRV